MGKQRAPKKKVNTDAWLNTYADMVTLVLCLFVLLFSVSSIDSDKWEIVVRALNPEAYAQAAEAAKTAAGGPSAGEATKGTETDPQDITDMNELYAALKEYVEENKLETDVEVMKGEGFTFIVFRNNIFFDGDKYYLKEGGRKVLDYLCASLMPVNEQIAQLRVWGHTNQANPNKRNDPTDDWTLSAMRAATVAAYIDQKGFLEHKKIIEEGYGQNYPIGSFDTESERQKNRRVEILIAENQAVNIAIEQVYEQLNRENSTFDAP